MVTQEQISKDNLRNENFEDYFKRKLENPSALLYIDTWENFYDFGSINYNWLIPNSSIQEKIDLFKNEIKDGIGLHIRRTDMQESILQSKTDLFIEKINYELSLNPNTKFYLATDSPIEKTRIVSMFKDRIITNDNVVYSRNSQEGMIDSVIDLFCLASTRKIYGSHGSSFSIEASMIGNIDLIVLHSEWGEYLPKGDN